MERDEILESLWTLFAVFPARAQFDALVDEGAVGNEVHTITGDDLASACYALQNLADNLDFDTDVPWWEQV